jgi:hypothetical protein
MKKNLDNCPFLRGIFSNSIGSEHLIMLILRVMIFYKTLQIGKSPLEKHNWLFAAYAVWKTKLLKKGPLP